MRSRHAENLLRSSALSIDCGDVPRILTLFACSGSARLLGPCPPTETMTPSACSIVDVEDALERDLLEEERVALVVVGRDGLRVVVDHHRAVAELAQRADRADGAPVELDRRADAVRAAAEHHRRLRLARRARGRDGRLGERRALVGAAAVVRHVEVVGLRGELRGERVDLLDARLDVRRGGARARRPRRQPSSLRAARRRSPPASRAAEVGGDRRRVRGRACPCAACGRGRASTGTTG